MNKVAEILKSRTVWTLILVLTVNLVDAYTGKIPTEYLIGINVILATLAGFFRINPKQQF